MTKHSDLLGRAVTESAQMRKIADAARELVRRVSANPEWAHMYAACSGWDHLVDAVCEMEAMEETDD